MRSRKAHFSPRLMIVERIVMAISAYKCFRATGASFSTFMLPIKTNLVFETIKLKAHI